MCLLLEIVLEQYMLGVVQDDGCTTLRLCMPLSPWVVKVRDHHTDVWHQSMVKWEIRRAAKSGGD